MTTPLVSVCVPTYNYGRFLAQCIESVQAQTLANWELVICDDDSTDDTRAIAEAYAAKDPRIRYIHNPRRLGMNGNIKFATEQGRGKYLKPLCADDWLAPRYLEVLVGLLERHPSAALATSATTTTDEHGTPLEVSFLFGKELLRGEEMLDRMARAEGFGGHSSFLLRADAYRRIGGYDADLLYASDYDLGARLCRVGDYAHSDEPLFYGRLHGATSSSTNPAKLHDVQDWFAIPRKVLSPRPPFSRDWRRYHMLTARLTSRYLANVVLERRRGRREYADALWRLLRKEGNFALGVPYLAIDLPSRALRRARGAKGYPTRAPAVEATP